MEEVTKEYIFTALDGSKKALKDLFGTKSQLIIYHFMLAPEQDEGCRGCSFTAEHFPDVRHLGARDVAFTAVARAPIAKIDAYNQRTGWKFPWICPLTPSFVISRQFPKDSCTLRSSGNTNAGS
jgi:predicted dithiol-disulfide oxidoreductase (DUF899 family)